jgi:hypothetical protein
LFETYAFGRQWYIVIELLTSISVGSLKSYQVLQQNCGRLLWAGTAIFDAYAISQVALCPNRNRHVQIFYITIAICQAAALTAQAIASVSTSEETQEEVKTVTQSIVTATEYLMMLKTLFDIGLRFKSWYDRIYALNPLVAPQLAKLTTPTDISLQEMLSVPVLPVEELFVLSDEECISLEPTLVMQNHFLFGEEKLSFAARTLNDELEEIVENHANP